MVSADPQAVSAILDAPASRSPALAAAASRPADWTSEWFCYLMPDISDETAKRITKARAWPAFNAVFRALRSGLRRAESAGRKGNDAALTRAAAFKAGVLDGEGIRGIARSVGIVPKAMSRQIAALQAIGVLAAFRPPATMTRDTDTGRIVRRPVRAGRVEAARIVITLGDEHRRPANSQGFNRPLRAPGRTDKPQAAQKPLRVVRTPSPKNLKGRSDTTSISPLDISLPIPPAPAKDGRRVGDPGPRPDGPRNGLPAGSQEEGPTGRLDHIGPSEAPGEADRSRPGEEPAGTQGPTGGQAETVTITSTAEHHDLTETGPQGTSTGHRPRPAKAAWAAWFEDVSPLTKRLRAERAEAIARKAKEKAERADAEKELRRSLDELPDESRQRAADLGEDLAGIEDDAKRLAEIVRRRKADAAVQAKAETKAKSEIHRAAYRKKKSTAAA